MSCSSLKANLKQCRNWSCLDSPYCHAHKDVTPEVLRSRWVRRYILGQGGFPTFSFFWKSDQKQLLKDLRSRKITLRRQDIESIPTRDRYIDIFILLIENEYATPYDNPALYARCIYHFCYSSIQTSHLQQHGQLGRIARITLMGDKIEQILIIHSGRTLFDFIYFLPVFIKSNTPFSDFILKYIPSILDSRGAKELSWWSRTNLNELREHYEKEIGKDNPFTRCLLERWLPDLKELYITEKNIQKLKIDSCKEELMAVCWHPSRVSKYLDMGIDINEW